MSARSSITARQMETWAHGQEIFDCLGVVREEGDQIKNIVHLGVSTFAWTFLNRQLDLPKEVPYVSLILPSITVGLFFAGGMARLTRSSLVDVLNQDYIRTAKAKGLSRFVIIKDHALKNALNPVVTAISGWFASLLAGAVFVEFIFGWNGIGKEIVNALNLLDLPVIMGAVLVIAFIFILINIIVDIIYMKLDPRIKIN